jgi:hypothetical protein
VNKRGKISYVFASSNTSQGFYTFIPDLIAGLKRVYILKGATGTGKSTFIRLLGEAIAEQGYEVEFWISAADGVSADGVYIPQLDTALVNGSLPQPIDPGYPAGREVIINLGAYWDNQQDDDKAQELAQLAGKFQLYSHQVTHSLKDAIQVQAKIKKINAQHLNPDKMAKLIQDVSARIMENRSRGKHYFASVVTAEGMINYLDEISSQCSKRYIFQGPTGGGTSAIISKLASQLKEHGYTMDYYHCGLEPEDIVMVIIRNLQIALVDGSYKEIPAQPGDIIIDVKICLDNYDEELVKAQTSELQRNYETFILQAQKDLEEAQRALKEIKKINSAAMNFEPVQQKRQQIWEEIVKSDC